MDIASQQYINFGEKEAMYKYGRKFWVRFDFHNT